MIGTSDFQRVALAAWLSVAIVTSCLAGPAAQKAVIDSRQVVEVPVELFSNKLLLVVTINGHNYTAVYDSGAQTSALSSVAAQEMGLKGTNGGTAQGFGGAIDYKIAPNLTIEFGTGRQTYVALPIFDFSGLTASLGRRFDFIFGSDAMRGHIVEVDPGKRRIRWTQRSAFAAPKDAVMLRMGRHRGVYTLPMEVNGVTGTAGIDIGSGSALAVSREFAQRAGFPLGAGASRQGSGIGGDFESRITSAASVRLAGTPMADVPTLLDSGELPSGADINLGLPLLLRFKLSLDYASRRIWFAPLAENEVQPFERNLVGLRVARVGADLIKLLHVSDQSPAHAAGLVSGDLIVAIDDVRVVDWPNETPIDSWMYGPANSTRTLTVVDGRKVLVTLKRYY